MPSPEQVLDQEVAKWTKLGYAVENRSTTQVVMAKGKRPNHLLHLILTILTVGLWGLFDWLPLSIFKREHRRVITVDGQGQVNVDAKWGR